ncbi:MAG: hypothetical protein BHV88_01275 [Clostridiales bacterium 41_12_two_minus]|nr:MAG: hypothetical protein BHV88_01275 [Clostridiales bacterium 41_12_two_minus]
MDYSIHDAMEAGFDKIIFIIRKDIEEAFREAIGERIEKICAKQGVEVAPQHERLHGGQHGQRRKPDAHHQQDHLPLRERQVQGEFQTLVGHLGNELHQRQQYAQQHGQVLEDVDVTSQMWAAPLKVITR